MSDDEDAHFGAADFGDALAGETNGVGVEAAIGFVEDGELGLQHGELEDFSPFHFAAGEAVVDVAAGEFGIHFELFHFRFQFLAEFAHGDELFAFFAIGAADVGGGMAEEVGHFHTGDGHRALEGRGRFRGGQLIGFHFQHIVRFTVGVDELDFAFGDVVAGMAGDGVAEGAFAGAVRTHESVNFAAAELEVQAFEDGLAVNGNVQVGDAKGFGHLVWFIDGDHGFGGMSKSLRVEKSGRCRKV